MIGGYALAGQTAKVNTKAAIACRRLTQLSRHEILRQADSAMHSCTPIIQLQHSPPLQGCQPNTSPPCQDPGSCTGCADRPGQGQLTSLYHGSCTKIMDWMLTSTCSRVDTPGLHEGPDQVPSRLRHTLPQAYLTPHRHTAFHLGPHLSPTACGSDTDSTPCCKHN